MNKILVLLISLSAVYAENNTFVATKFWKTIEEGQAIPAGLHVRINLTSGLKEAKLLDEAEVTGKDNALLALSEEAASGSPKLESLKEALKNIPAESFVEYSDEIKAKFKSYAKIKSELSDLKMSIKTDNEIIENLIKTYENQTENEHIDLIFVDLEYLMHQIDNALHFIESKGVEKLILPNLDTTRVNIQTHSLRLLGTVLQNNPAAQRLVLKKKVTKPLFNILESGNNDTALLSSCIFAISSLLRKFPAAQSEMLPQSLETMIKLLDDSAITLKIQLKVLTLISDLITEFNEKDSVDTSEHFNLPSELVKFKFCATVDKLFDANRKEFVNDLSSADSFLSAVEIHRHNCYETWSESPQFRHNLLVMKNTFTKNNSQEQDEYLGDLIATVTTIVDNLYKEIKIKEEL